MNLQSLLLSVVLVCSVMCKAKVAPGDLQKLPDEILIKRIVDNDLPEPVDITIRSEQGSIIQLDSMIILVKNEGYTQDFYANEKGEVVEIRLRPKTPEDEILYNGINKALNPTPELKRVVVDCNDLVNKLTQVYERDQGVRTESIPYDPSIDQENLEIVVSIIESCGFPRQGDIGAQPMDAVWLVLQHSNLEYLSKYLPVIKERAAEGEYAMANVALSEDRVLMWQGKPQLYGSQIMSDELYELFEPEYVDFRRQQMGMGPLKDYVAHFGLEFSVLQKIPDQE